MANGAQDGSRLVQVQAPAQRFAYLQAAVDDAAAEGQRGEELLIPLLQAVQGKFGYLPAEDLAAVAEVLHVPLSRVYGVATFYNQFRLTPVGKHIIRSCTGTACHVKGAQMLRDALQAELGIAPGQTTPDGRFTWELVACLGACGMAPVIMIDDEFHGRLTPQQLPRILRMYSA